MAKKNSKNKKANKIPNYSKSYKSLGIGLLIISLFELIWGIGRFFLALFFVPNFYTYLVSYLIPINNGLFFFYFFMSLSTLLSIWALVLSIYLIRNNKYTKQILYLVYGWICYNLLVFIADLSGGSFIPSNLISALLIYFILILFNNPFSRFIKGK